MFFLLDVLTLIAIIITIPYHIFGTYFQSHPDLIHTMSITIAIYATSILALSTLSRLIS